MTARDLRRYAVIGGDTRNSLSPAIHRYFAVVTRKPAVYAALSADEGGFRQAVEDFWALPGNGLNVTVPHKMRAAKLADKLSSMGRKTGAVNVLRRDEKGQVWGYNTDGVGLVIDLRRVAGKSLQGSRILVVGAGGAVAGILPSLLKEDLSGLYIANRTASKAEELAAASESAGAKVEGGGAEGISGKFDIALNAVPGGLGLSADGPLGCAIGGVSIAYDLNYGSAAQPFMRIAREQGVPCVSDGLGMLVEQASFSFAVWEGVRPTTAKLLRALRERLAS